MYGAPMMNPNYYGPPMAPPPMMPPPMMPPPMMAPMAPTYYPVLSPPPPPPPPPPQTIIITRNNNKNSNASPCSTCGDDTGNIPRRKVGMVAIIWCLLLTSCFICYIPLCCTDSCKDIEIVCVKCQTVKNKIAANCC